MSDWKEYSLKSLGNVITGKTPSKNNPADWGNEMPFVTPSDYKNYLKKATTSIRSLSKDGIERLKNKVLPPKSVLVTCIGSDMGKVVMNEVETITNQQINSIIPKKKSIDNDFLYYCLVAMYDLLRVYGGDGTAVPIVNKGDFENLEILLPSLPEQKAIASVLSSLDDKIVLLHRQNKTLEAMVETIFRQWFVEEAQDDWESVCLEDHIDAYRGLSYKGSGLSESGIGLPMHNLNSVYEGGGYKETGIKFYSGEFKERHLIRPGDVIVANTEQGHEFKLIGFPAIVPKCFGDIGLFSQHIYRLIPKTNSSVTTEYLYYLLMTPLVREQITAATNGSTVNMLAIDGLQRPEFKLPPREKIAHFTRQVKLLWKKKDINESQIRTLEKLRDTLLPKLMSGEVRVEYEN